MSDVAQATERLQAAIPSKERRQELFGPWLDDWASDKGKLVRELTSSEVASLRAEFESTLLATVSPADILTVCPAAKPNRVVRDLELGSTRAKKTRPDGTPNTVMILARDLETLLGQLSE